MTWLTWRQFRTGGVVVFAGLAALAAILALTGPGLATDYASGLAECTQSGSDCGAFTKRFFEDYRGAFLAVTAISLVLPALIGLFWGAPLVSRELETGTHRLVWNQSITRTRWLAVKLVITGLAAMAAAGLCSLAVTWWSSTIDRAAGEDYPRLGSLVFDARGVVPIAYAAFAFVLGVTVGMLARRALPAMAITLAVFVTAQVAMPFLVRPHLQPPTRETVVISQSILDSLMRNPETGLMGVEARAPKDGDWLLSSQTVDASGKAVEEIKVPLSSGPCAPSGAPDPERMKTCFAEVERLGYRQQMTYHAADRFWPFQWIESGIYLAVALALAGGCFWWTRRRLS